MKTHILIIISSLLISSLCFGWDEVMEHGIVLKAPQNSICEYFYRSCSEHTFSGNSGEHCIDVDNSDTLLPISEFNNKVVYMNGHIRSGLMRFTALGIPIREVLRYGPNKVFCDVARANR